METEWVKKFPGRLEYELKALNEIGSRFKVDNSDLERGPVTISGAVKIGEEEIYVIVKYPDFYPFFRCEIYAPDLKLRHHQNPFSKNLCLLHRSTEKWDVEFTAASLIKEQLPKVLKVNSDIDDKDALDLEIEQAEPITVSMSGYLINASVLFDSAWSINKDIDQGKIIFGQIPNGNDYQWAINKMAHRVLVWVK